MRVLMAGKVFRTHVGGNTTYARALESELITLGVDVHRPRRGPTNVIASSLSEASLSLTHTGYDLVHYPADTGALVGHPKTPIVSTIHGMAALHGMGVRTPVQERIWRLRVGRMARLSKRVITVSRSSAKDLSSAFDLPLSKFTVIYHGIDHDRFNTNSGEGDATLSRFRLPKTFALFVGNVEPRKNLTTLIRAIDGLRAKGNPIELVVAGRPAWGSGPILEAMATRDYCHYLGQVTDDVVPSLMRRCTVFGFPSLYEGFGFPVLEAMACGAPVVTSNRGSLQELAAQHAKVVDPTSASDLGAAISHILENDALRASLVANGLQHAKSFTWRASAEAHIRVYRDVRNGAHG